MGSRSTGRRRHNHRQQDQHHHADDSSNPHPSHSRQEEEELARRINASLLHCKVMLVDCELETQHNKINKHYNRRRSTYSQANNAVEDVDNDSLLDDTLRWWNHSPDTRNVHYQGQSTKSKRSASHHTHRNDRGEEYSPIIPSYALRHGASPDEDAMMHAERALSLATRYGLPQQVAKANLFLGHCHRQLKGGDGGEEARKYYVRAASVREFAADRGPEGLQALTMTPRKGGVSERRYGGDEVGYYNDRRQGQAQTAPPASSTRRTAWAHYYHWLGDHDGGVSEGFSSAGGVPVIRVTDHDDHHNTSSTREDHGRSGGGIDRPFMLRDGHGRLIQNCFTGGPPPALRSMRQKSINSRHAMA